MHFPQLQPGDVFGTRNPMALGRAINFLQKIWSRDSESKYSHSGIILDEEGTTFEALWTIKKQNLFEAYGGKEVIIARYTKGTDTIIKTELDFCLSCHEGQWYPIWRLPLHIFPPLAKIMLFHHPVCSELVAEFLCEIGARHCQWASTNPDTLADEWRRWKNFEIIWEGELK